MYARTPGMRQPGTVWPTPDGIGLAADPGAPTATTIRIARRTQPSGAAAVIPWMGWKGGSTSGKGSTGS